MASLDLEAIIAKLCHPTRGLGWERERAIRGAAQYQRWLWLFTTTESHRLSPSPDIDQVWHMHILDTRKYAEDCNAMFGHIFHHDPYAGWENEAAEVQHQENYRYTCELYSRHFDDHLDGMKGICDGGCYGQDIDSKPIWRPTLANLPKAA